MVWPAIISAGASLAGGLLSSKGQRDANSANQQIAAQNIEFQREMSNTAYQRSMADMQKAGLNPILAYKQGGASTPSGTTIPVQNELDALGDATASAASSALNARQQAQELRNLKETEKLIEQQRNAAAASEYQSTTQGWLNNENRKVIEAIAIDKGKAETDNLKAHNKILGHQEVDAATSALRSRLDLETVNENEWARVIGTIARELGINPLSAAKTLATKGKL